jgi:uncharacterized surface protein with fasciclin (FAS1) repeats
MAFRPHRQVVKRMSLLLGVIATGTAIALPVTAGNNYSPRFPHQIPSTLPKSTAAPAALTAGTTADTANTPVNADDRLPPVIRVSPPSGLTSPATRTTPASNTPALSTPADTPASRTPTLDAPTHTLPAQSNPSTNSSSGNSSAGNLMPTSPTSATPAQPTQNPASPTSPATATPAKPEPSNPAASPTHRSNNQPSNQRSDRPSSPAIATNTVVDVAASNEKFKTLMAALNEAELTQVLKGDGPFTLFAPTDEAFNALPAGTLEELLKPENRATLLKVLTYHVVPGKVTAGQLRAGEVRTVEGSPVTVAIKNDKVTVNGANVTQTDIMASNGVIHAIDKVILPGM